MVRMKRGKQEDYEDPSGPRPRRLALTLSLRLLLAAGLRPGGRWPRPRPLAPARILSGRRRHAGLGPGQLMLRFNNRIEKPLSRIRLVDAARCAAALTLSADGGGADRLIAAVPSLAGRHLARGVAGAVDRRPRRRRPFRVQGRALVGPDGRASGRAAAGRDPRAHQPGPGRRRLDAGRAPLGAPRQALGPRRARTARRRGLRRGWPRWPSSRRRSSRSRGSVPPATGRWPISAARRSLARHWRASSWAP